MGLTTLQPLAYAVSYVTFFFGTASIFLRIYCRLFILKTWGWDDYIALAILVRCLSHALALLRLWLMFRVQAFSIVQQAVLHMFLYWGCGL